LPPLPPPTGIVKPAAPASDVRRKIVVGVMSVGATLAVALIAYAGHVLSQKDPPADARLRGAASNPPDAAPGGPLDAQPPDAGPPLGDCPMGMVPVPAGTFLMGSPEGVGETDEHPHHVVTLSAYCIDQTEVTVKAYAACVAAKGCSAASRTVSWSGYSAADVKRYSRFCNSEDRPDHPINCVDWNQAAAYCRWAGKRLPTEAEWEYAARGSDGRAYPWGNGEPRAKLLNACGLECVAMARRELNQDWKQMYDASDGWETTAPVGSFPDGASPFGALDMAGNVWEWTSDRYGNYPGAAATNPLGPETGPARVLRGGAWKYPDPGHVRTTCRHGHEASVRSIVAGFRCARGD
jgi:formylglycine-generating enzyme required for sulfatase activity